LDIRPGAGRFPSTTPIRLYHRNLRPESCTDRFVPGQPGVPLERWHATTEEVTERSQKNTPDSALRPGGVFQVGALMDASGSPHLQGSAQPHPRPGSLNSGDSSARKLGPGTQSLYLGLSEAEDHSLIMRLSFRNLAMNIGAFRNAIPIWSLKRFQRLMRLK